MAEEQNIFESIATYYDEYSKRWKSGVFKLNESCISFYCDELEVLNIPLNTLSALEKRQTSLIYAAIVVSVGVEKHWFASFPNRDSLYNLLELFWRDALLTKNHIASPDRPRTASSEFGKELLNILHESETTLVNAANALSDQGRQIEETQNALSDINSDLNVAERFIRNMSSFSSMFLKASGSNANLVQGQETRKCFKINYAFSETVTDGCAWEKGILFLEKETISMVNDDRTEEFTIGSDDVISCQVIFPWKIHMKILTNKTQKSCYIVCPKLMKLLKYFNSSSVKDKIHYDNSSSLTSQSPQFAPSSSGSSRALLSSTQTAHNNNSLPDVEQLQENNTMISDEDLEEISNMLSSLQSLAVEVSREQQDQMEKINSLVSNVESTELRMRADTSKLKKL